MRAVIQRVSRAQVTVAGRVVGSIGAGLTALIGISGDDTGKDAGYLAEKIVNLRIFDDDRGVMNLSALETGAGILAVSQFTLCGDCRKGRRPSYAKAAPPQVAKPLWELFLRELSTSGLPVATGEFQAMMAVELVNDGPVTILLDSTRLF
ncbi:MAG: D-aminoacyl-tRNA deacylase [Thermodesulfobacteriota bacterium]